MMKGVVIERATPGNILDVFPNFREFMLKEVRYPKATPDQVKAYYWTLFNQLGDPNEIVLIARKGKVYWGFFHGSLVFRPFGDQQKVLFIKSIYVAEKKRKLGIAKQLYMTAQDLCQKMGITKGEFLCDDSLTEYWEKKIKAKKVMALMTVEKI